MSLLISCPSCHGKYGYDYTVTGKNLNDINSLLQPEGGDVAGQMLLALMAYSGRTYGTSSDRNSLLFAAIVRIPTVC